MAQRFGLVLLTGITCLVVLWPEVTTTASVREATLDRAKMPLTLAQTTSEPHRSDPPPHLSRWIGIGLIPIGLIGIGFLGRFTYRSRQSRSQGLTSAGQSSQAHPGVDSESYTFNQPHNQPQSELPDSNPTQVMLSDPNLSDQPPATEPLTPFDSTQPSEPTSLVLSNAVPVASTQADLNLTTRLAKVDIVEALVTDLHSADAAKRRKAIWELGQHGDSRAVQPLVDLLIDSDSQQRSLILAAIAEISSRALTPMNRALMLSLQDENVDVRKNAIRDITRVYELMTQASQLLQYAASDSDTEVQETARWALNQLNQMRSSELDSTAAGERRSLKNQS